MIDLAAAGIGLVEERDEGVSVAVCGATLATASRRSSSRVIVGPINLVAAPGEVVALVGASGAGKSTILNFIAGTVRPTCGSVALMPPNGSARLRVGLAPQSPALLPWLTLRENVALPGALRHNWLGAQVRADELLCRLGLASVRDCRPAAVSGGMQSRASLARALLCSPNLLLLDEPFSHLDEVTAEKILLDLSNVVADTCCTIVIVSHNIDQAVFLADRVVVMAASPGRIIDTIEICARRPRSSRLDRDHQSQVAGEEIRKIMRELG